MHSINWLALGSVICGGVASIAHIVWLGFYWLYAARRAFDPADSIHPDPSTRVEQLAPFLGLSIPMVAGLVGVALATAALDRPGVRQGERRGRTLARVGIALCMLPLLLFCLHFSVLLSQEGAGVFGH